MRFSSVASYALFPLGEHDAIGEVGVAVGGCVDVAVAGSGGVAGDVCSGVGVGVPAGGGETVRVRVRVLVGMIA